VQPPPSRCTSPSLRPPLTFLQDFIALVRASCRRLASGLHRLLPSVHKHPRRSFRDQPLASGAGASVFDQGASARCDELAGVLFEGEDIRDVAVAVNDRLLQDCSLARLSRASRMLSGMPVILCVRCILPVQRSCARHNRRCCRHSHRLLSPRSVHTFHRSPIPLSSASSLLRVRLHTRGRPEAIRVFQVPSRHAADKQAGAASAPNPPALSLVM
jgi:hypothetical protein